VKRKIRYRKSPDPKDRRTAVVFVDYENIRFSLPNFETRRTLSSLNWLKDLLFKKLGPKTEIVLGFVFVPNHLFPGLSRGLFDTGFYVVGCPPNFGETLKYTDSADRVMISMMRDQLELARFTDLVIVGGDGDYVSTVNLARSRGKKVLILSLEKALSNRYQDYPGWIEVTVIDEILANLSRA